MSFVSIKFFILYFIFYKTYWLLNRNKQNLLLLLGSYLFYAFWGIELVIILFLITCSDYFFARKIYSSNSNRNKKLILYFSIIIDLSFLIIFKYAVIFNDISFNLLNYFISIPNEIKLFKLLATVGMSFYIFQSLGYVIDVFYGIRQPASSLIEYAVFTSFFPKMISGPIERSSNLLLQIEHNRNKEKIDYEKNIYLIIWGIFKKLFVADNLRACSINFLQHKDSFGLMDVLLLGYIYSFQIYADFSGYTDIIRGVSGLLGFTLLENFNLPFFARNVSEIWHRWHISLCNWVRDYLFNYFVLKIKNKLCNYLLIFLLMCFIGVWHGTGINYLLWGVYHGGLLCLYAILKDKKIFPIKMLVLLKILFVFNLFALGEIIFFTENISDLGNLYSRLLFYNHYSLLFEDTAIKFILYISILFIIEIIQYIKKDKYIILKINPVARSIFYFFIYLLINFYGSNSGNKFIYLQF